MNLDHLRLPLHWHDRFGRKDGQGDAPSSGFTEVPAGQCNRFSFAVSDNEGFVVAHCTNALVTCSSDWSEANAKLFAAAPKLYAVARLLVNAYDAPHRFNKGDAVRAAREVLAQLGS